MEEMIVRHLLTPVQPSMDDFFYADWNMNLYRGCTHGCIYCDTRSICYRVERFDQIRPKKDALRILEEELRSKRRSGVITMGAMSDPYNLLEADLCLTRDALKLIHRYGFGAAFTTKSALCARDADILAKISRHAPVCARLTITCAEDDLCRRIEPHVSLSSERFTALRSLSDAGVFAGVWLNPVLPFLTDTPENILGVVRKTAKAGGKFISCFFSVTLRTGNREYYFDALQQEFPGVRHTYTSVFGNAYECTSPRAEELFALYREECERLGLLWRFSDINRAMMATQPVQTSLFD